jgi:hypothetical protein
MPKTPEEIRAARAAGLQKAREAKLAKAKIEESKEKEEEYIILNPPENLTGLVEQDEIIPVPNRAERNEDGGYRLKPSLLAATYKSRVAKILAEKKKDDRLVKVIVNNNASGEAQLKAVPVTASSQAGKSISAVVPFGIPCELHPAIIGVLDRIKIKNVINATKLDSAGGEQVTVDKTITFSPKYSITYI